MNLKMKFVEKEKNGSNEIHPYYYEKILSRKVLLHILFSFFLKMKFIHREENILSNEIFQSINAKTLK